MKIEQFSPEIPGKIETIKVVEAGELVADHAFIPNPLPPKWELPSNLWPAIAEAKQQIGILEGIGRNLPNPGILLRPLGDREAIQSSRLEGTYLTPKELLLFELEPRESKSEDDPANDQREVLNYRYALNHGINSELPLSLRLLGEMHRILMTGVRGKDKTPGDFRKLQVAIGSSRRFIPPPPDKVLSCLHEMELYLHQDESKYDPLVDCFLVHYQFETIHPFNDGNGRVGRLLLAIMMQKRCQMSKPWLYLSEFFERYREEYVDLLFRVSAKNDWESWIDFCLRATVTQARETIIRCEKLLKIRDEFNTKLLKVGGSVRLSQIVEMIFHSPFVRIAELSRILKVTYPTAKADVLRLADAKILKELPNISPMTYYAPEVFRVAYKDISTESTD